MFLTFNLIEFTILDHDQSLVSDALTTGAWNESFGTGAVKWNNSYILEFLLLTNYALLTSNKCHECNFWIPEVKGYSFEMLLFISTYTVIQFNSKMNILNIIPNKCASNLHSCHRHIRFDNYSKNALWKSLTFVFEPYQFTLSNKIGYNSCAYRVFQVFLVQHVYAFCSLMNSK